MRKKIPIISMILVGMHTTNKPASEKNSHSLLVRLISCIFDYPLSPIPHQPPNRLPPIPHFSLSSSNNFLDDNFSGTPTPPARRDPVVEEVSPIILHPLEMQEGCFSDNSCDQKKDECQQSRYPVFRSLPGSLQPGLQSSLSAGSNYPPQPLESPQLFMRRSSSSSSDSDLYFSGTPTPPPAPKKGNLIKKEKPQPKCFMFSEAHFIISAAGKEIFPRSKRRQD